MIDFVKEMETILKTDPLGLLEVTAKASLVISSDERLVSSFEEINTFMRKYNREPTASRDISERKLYSRLKGFRENLEKAAALAEFDVFNLLGDVKISELKEINSIDDVMENDVLGLLGNDLSVEADPNDIFNLKNVPKHIDMPDYIAKRKPCKDFDRFKQLFEQCHADLVSRKKELRQFAGEQQIETGHFFILYGVMVYVAEVGKKEKKRGKVNARLRCIFENGTESDMLLRSLARDLYKDETGRRVLNVNCDLLNETEIITEGDKETGYIYVLRSLNDDPKIKEMKNLYKIGFSNKPVTQRIENAKQEPTYLMADVVPIAEFKAYNLNIQKLEMLLHRFFAEACLSIDVFDGEDKRYTPREWFIVPLHVIETVIKLLINGEIVNYRYDSQRQEIIDKLV